MWVEDSLQNQGPILYVCKGTAYQNAMLNKHLK